MAIGLHLSEELVEERVILVDFCRLDPEPRQKNRLPASLGLSVLLGLDATGVAATVSFAEYLAQSRVLEGDEGERPKQVWRRYPRPPALDERQLAHGLAVPNTSGIVLVGKRPNVCDDESPGDQRVANLGRLRRPNPPNPPFLKGGSGMNLARASGPFGAPAPDLAPPFVKGGGRGEDFSRGGASGEEVSVSRWLREKSPQPPFLKGGLRNEPRSRIVLPAHRLRIWLPLL